FFFHCCHFHFVFIFEWKVCSTYLHIHLNTDPNSVGSFRMLIVYCCKGTCNFFLDFFLTLSCQKGHKIGYKCFLAYRAYENYTDASQKCQERGGRMAMPRDRKEQEALAEYVKSVFHGNWPVWLGISDERSEGLYLFEDTTRVTYFQWRKHFLSSQPDGGKRENCVAMSSDDGDWWDTYCERRMYYLCEFDV
uniref:C-type lectin domain containing 11A n=1 Tax=Sinocyclocheilus anshuiensis TaxID=1608454 RepID=A0A671QNW0_9TELE